MKKWIVVPLMVILMGLFWSCSDYDNSTEPELDTTNPIVNIAFPANNAEFDDGTTVTIKGDASDNESISKVEFYIDGSLKYSDTTTPYEYSWNTSGEIGTHTIMLKAYDPSNNISFTPEITIEVISLNNAPVINELTASPPRVNVNNKTIIKCSGNDIDGDNLTFSWSCTGGSILGSDSIVTWYAPGSIGAHFVKCLVSDGKLTDIDSLEIFVDIPDSTVYVEGGTFFMGDHFNEDGEDDLPIHSVTVSGFYISKYEVTQEEWSYWMPDQVYNYGGGDKYPVYHVSWYEIIKYCNLRSMSEDFLPCYSIVGSTNPDDWGIVPTQPDSIWDAVICNWDADGYRLPTEAEWEYAARGGKYNTDNYRYSGSNIIGDVAWYDGNNMNDLSHQVGTKEPNQLGIYDMSGNVWEWCWDKYNSSYYEICDDLGTVINPHGPEDGDLRIKRGGYWYNYSNFCEINYRLPDYPVPYYDYYYVGFRLARKP